MKNLLPVLFLLAFINSQGQIPDAVYTQNIKSVQLHPYGNQLGYPVIRLNSSDQLELHFDDLDANEREEWHRVRTRMLRICETAARGHVGVFVDAEETWIQDPVDALTILMMDTYNKEKCIVYNTTQHYRHDRLQFLKDSFDAAVERKFILGAKLVRGAYMEKERKRAAEMNYPSPIQPNKESSDKDLMTPYGFV